MKFCAKAEVMTDLPERARPLLARLDALGIVHRTVTHPPLFTVAESQALRGQIAGAHVKNLFVKDKKGRLFLVTTLEDAAVDLKRLHETIGAQGRVSFCSADQLHTHLGVEPGSVTPFAVMNDAGGAVTLVLDAALMQQDVINAHPLTNTATTTIARDDLLRFIESTGHVPQILALPAPSAAES